MCIFEIEVNYFVSIYLDAIKVAPGENRCGAFFFSKLCGKFNSGFHSLVCLTRFIQATSASRSFSWSQESERVSQLLFSWEGRESHFFGDYLVVELAMWFSSVSELSVSWVMS